MQLKVYEIAWGETVTSSGAIAGDVVTYNITFSDQGVQGPVGPSGPQGAQGLPGDFVVNFRVVSASETLVSKAKIAANTTSGALTLTLPANPTNGDVIDFYDYAETFDTNNLTIARNGSRIEGLEENLICNVKGAYFSLVYSGSTRGWQVLPSFGTSGGGGETVLTTQGDTLYRGLGVNQRLPIGSPGHILKVNSGGTAPEWGAAPATGVTSVALSSSDLTVSGSPVTSSGTITANLANSGVSAGTYSKVTVDAKGRVTTGANAGIADVTGLQTALDAKQPSGSYAASVHTHAISDVTGLQTALDSKQASGNYATLVSGKVPSDQLPSFVDDVLEYANLAAFPVTGESGKIYVAIDTRKTYRWSGSAYVEISPSEVTSVAGRTGAVTLAVADVSDAVPTSRTISAGTGLTGGGNLTADRTLAVSYGTTSGTACQGNDSRLSDSRTPTAHAASHASTGSDPLFDQDLNTTDSVEFAGVIAPTVLYPDANGAGFNIQNAELYSGGAAVFGWAGATINFGKAIDFDGNNAASDKATSRTNLGLAIGTDVAAASHTHTPSEVGLGNVSNTAQVTSVTGTAPIVSSGGTTPAISVTVGTGANTVAAGDDSRFHARSHAITSTSDHTAGNHKVFYSNGSGEIVELALGSSGTVLTSNGATAAPSFTAASGGDTVSIDASAADILSATSGAISADDAGSDKIVFWDDSAGKLTHLTVGSGLTLTDTTLTASGGVGGGSGSVDNAIIRADGTGGSTVQSSAINILDASTTTQNNVAITNDHSGQTNSALVLTPKGTGAFIVGPRPDGTSTGGNARGARAINIAMTRTAANQVASGDDSIAIGNGSRASGTDSIAMGGGGALGLRAVAICPTQGTGGGDNAVCIGYNALASFAGSVAVGANAVSNTGNYSVALGDTALARSGNSFGCLRNSAADADNSISIGRESSVTGVNSISLGAEVISTLRGVFSTKMFNAIYWGGQTTTNAATILNLDATATNRFTIAANTALAVDVLLVARRSDVADKWLVARRFLGIRRDGSNNTSLIGAVQTFGTDQSEGSPTWSFTLTADDTNEALRLEVTGATSETVQWRATAFYRAV